MASVRLREGNGTAKQEHSAGIKDNTAGMEWETKVEGIDLGVTCADMIQEADRTFVAEERTQHQAEFSEMLKIQSWGTGRRRKARDGEEIDPEGGRMTCLRSG